MFIITLCRPSPHQDWGRMETAFSCFARDDKEPGSQLGEAITRRNRRDLAHEPSAQLVCSEERHRLTYRPRRTDRARE